VCKTLALLGVAFVLVGCMGPIAIGKRAYEDSRYLEAAEWLGAHEPQLAQLPAHEQAEYGIYRGLALLHVGDRAAAQRWLTFAYSIEQACPGTLDVSQRTALGQGCKALGLSDGAAAPERRPSVPSDGPWLQPNCKK
jgi:hypothetical protein